MGEERKGGGGRVAKETRDGETGGKAAKGAKVKAVAPKKKEGKKRLKGGKERREREVAPLTSFVIERLPQLPVN